MITNAGGNYVGDHIPAAGGFKTVRICLARGVFRAGKDAIATAHMIMVIMNDHIHCQHRHYHCAFMDIFDTIFVFLSLII